MLKICEVKTLKDLNKFCSFPLELYKSNRYYVPELFLDELKAVNPYIHHPGNGITKSFLAYKNNKIVGRIQAIIPVDANKKWNESKIRFTRFDAINDKEVSDALFEKVKEFGKSHGLNNMVGPLGYSDLDREGLLIEGFDELSTFEESYNHAYYKDLVESYGFKKEVGWVESKIKNKIVIDPKYEKVSKLVLNKYELHYAKEKNIDKFLKKYGDDFFDILDDTYKDIYGTIPFTKDMRKDCVKNFKLICDVKYIAVILDKNEKPVAFGICFPSIAKSIQETNGKLFPLGFIKILREIKNPDILDLGLVGVKSEYRKMGVSSLIFNELIRMLKNPKIDHAETNLNLEDNLSIRNSWNGFDNKIHKKRNAYIKNI